VFVCVCVCDNHCNRNVSLYFWAYGKHLKPSLEDFSVLVKKREIET
jgi:hypothetical protein